ncbi:unnamed protein product, partial [Didymodactylos carnosus]
MWIHSKRWAFTFPYVRVMFRMNNPNLCYCNRPRTFHSENPRTNQKDWNIDIHTKSSVRNENGILKWGAKFVRCDIRTNPSDLIKILRIWDIKEPDAWLITSGFNVGIVQLVGRAIRKSKLINFNRTITAIGLPKYGCIKNVEKLTNANHQNAQSDNSTSENEHRKGERDLEPNHTHYIFLDDGTLRRYDTQDYRTRFVCELSNTQAALPVPAVTIVVEGGIDTITNMYYDLKNDIPVVIIDGSGRAANFFSRWISHTEGIISKAKADEWKTIVDIDEIDVYGKGVEKTNGTTTLLLDLSQQRLKALFKNHQTQIEENLREILHREAEDADVSLKKNFEQKVQQAILRVMYCLQPAIRNRITIFNLNDNSDLSDTIFRSIFESRQRLLEKLETQQLKKQQKRLGKHQNLNESERNRDLSKTKAKNKSEQDVQKQQLLALALDWNCIEVAKELIIQQSLSNIPDKKFILLKALTANLFNFVHFFIKIEMRIDEVLYPNFYKKDGIIYDTLIEKLYTTEIINGNNCLLSNILIQEDLTKQKVLKSPEELNRVLEILVGDYMKPLYYETYDEEKRERRPYLSKKKNLVEIEGQTTTSSTKNESERKLVQDYVFRDLFLWAILVNYIDMAKILLSHMKYRICSALLATKILKAYRDRIATHSDVKEKLTEQIDYFETFAIDCLELCHTNKPGTSCEIIVQQIALFGDVTCLQVAVAADSKRFVGQPCCGHTMANIWYDKLQPDQSKKRNKIQLLVGFLTFGLLAPFIVQYRKNKLKDENVEQKLKTYGINYSDEYAAEYPKRFQEPNINRAWHRLVNFHQSLQIKYLYHCVTICNCSILSTPKAFICCRLGSLHRISPILQIVLAYDLEIWFIRALGFINVVPFLGPHLVAIGKMLRDLLFFMVLIILIMTAYGVTSRSMSYYGTFEMISETEAVEQYWYEFEGASTYEYAHNKADATINQSARKGVINQESSQEKNTTDKTGKETQGQLNDEIRELREDMTEVTEALNAIKATLND